VTAPFKLGIGTLVLNNGLLVWKELIGFFSPQKYHLK
jgi:hypothetical protein